MGSCFSSVKARKRNATSVVEAAGVITHDTFSKLTTHAHLPRSVRLPKSSTMGSNTPDEPKLNLVLQDATEDDFDLFMKPLFTVFGKAVFVSALWPDNQTELGRQRAKERWLKEM
jgi:hypothetical protein